LNGINLILLDYFESGSLDLILINVSIACTDVGLHGNQKVATASSHVKSDENFAYNF